jgi:membrane-associated protein
MLELFNLPHLIHHYGYVGISIIVFLESGIFFPLPGDSLLFTAGILASSNLLNLHLLALIPIIFGSSFVGAIAGYYVGVYIIHLRKVLFFGRFLKDEHINKAHGFFETYGKFAVIFSKFLPVIRTFVPIAAGAARMDFKHFLQYNLIGSFVWAASVTSLGYFLGKIFPQIQSYLSWLIIAVVLVSVLPALYEYIVRRKRRFTHRESTM